jgi:predicted nucleic acid-binding protein
MRYNLTAYVAMYTALAESLGLPLLTHDAKLATAPPVFFCAPSLRSAW